MGSDKLILVVEDNAHARDLTRAWLERAGYRVACAADGREGLDLLGRGERPCLILLDLEMPVLDGWEFRARQRESPALASIPVILLSAADGLPRTAACLGVAGYFPKPVEFEGLLRAIRVLSKGRTHTLVAD